MTGLATPIRTDLSFAPIYEEILDLVSSTRSDTTPMVSSPNSPGGTSRLAIGRPDSAAGRGRCAHVSVLRQRYETAVNLRTPTHDLGFA